MTNRFAPHHHNHHHCHHHHHHHHNHHHYHHHHRHHHYHHHHYHHHLLHLTLTHSHQLLYGHPCRPPLSVHVEALRRTRQVWRAWIKADIYIDICTHTSTHTYMHTHIHSHLHPHTHRNRYTCKYRTAHPHIHLLHARRISITTYMFTSQAVAHTRAYMHTYTTMSLIVVGIGV